MIVSRGMRANLKIFSLLAVLTGFFLSAGFLLGGRAGAAIALVLAGIMNIGSYWFSDRIVLRIYGAEELTENEAPELHRALERLAENAGIPKPQLYRSSMEVPNAFATGRSPEKGVVCVTDGLLQQLDQEEVEGVIAHELAHIRNRDTLINASVATIAGAISLLAEMAFWGAMLGGDEDAGNLAGSLAFMIVVPLVATVIRLAISRKMEYRADSTGIQIHGKREGLSSALQKISSANRSQKPGKHVSKVQEAGSNLFIENPFSGDRLTGLFSTHPALEKRLENIEETEI